MCGPKDTLFVVRDLSSMVNLQKIMHTKQHLSTFTEKIVRQIQESSTISRMNLQKIEENVNNAGFPIAQETQAEVSRVLHRIRDFEQVFNICEGTFVKNDTNFSVSDEFAEI